MDNVRFLFGVRGNRRIIYHNHPREREREISLTRRSACRSNAVRLASSATPLFFRRDRYVNPPRLANYFWFGDGLSDWHLAGEKFCPRAEVFGSAAGTGANTPSIDVKSLENDFLEVALGKAGLLSVRR
jgi:hypothetical protein